ncbi:hypothetical protein [Sulfitobacter sabulilitoris]|uniref:Aspartate carbamoyltransferase catalytic subunit n=1 Tax=Sulfitobacter sabulilitoris TaxID=2562655 RepID=A0A5S3PM64_9RHOB|nr:hypothetical protein [Sulfitobacter sabulilitoris]TMM55524.1 hypothetical protein FDT80_08225 [Sulfitobacter sabulilitoris]
MTGPIHIPKGERGKIRVFAINRPVPEILSALETMSKPDLARDLLANASLDTATAEIFPVADLVGVGLAGYLADGYAVDEAQIAPDRARLEALDGYVLIVFSDSFGGEEVTLTPGADLTLIGTYSEFEPVTDLPPLTADSAQPYTGAPGVTPPAPARGPAGSAMAVMAVIAALALLVWWLFA